MCASPVCVQCPAFRRQAASKLADRHHVYAAFIFPISSPPASKLVAEHQIKGAVARPSHVLPTVILPGIAAANGHEACLGAHSCREMTVHGRANQAATYVEFPYFHRARAAERGIRTVVIVSSSAHAVGEIRPRSHLKSGVIAEPEVHRHVKRKL